MSDNRITTNSSKGTPMPNTPERACEAQSNSSFHRIVNMGPTASRKFFSTREYGTTVCECTTDERAALYDPPQVSVLSTSYNDHDPAIAKECDKCSMDDHRLFYIQ
ncbi:hypothetical protein KIN20_009155 [Parelaphostrongylus tenuis]|uniref:Uncharacterized protein n=1 Tax=Parelaphostrongylus tenuis TaxID=148309 RepID=A0AAD5QN62_PARTN|nr:hypothetical protein KIN20_009155 [Parelaphostrongylus tenuis]